MILASGIPRRLAEVDNFQWLSSSLFSGGVETPAALGTCDADAQLVLDEIEKRADQKACKPFFSTLEGTYLRDTQVANYHYFQVLCKSWNFWRMWLLAMAQVNG